MKPEEATAKRGCEAQERLVLIAAAYREVGGLEPRTSLEDEHLEQLLRQRGIPIERVLSVRVTTRQTRLAHDLALASQMQVASSS